MKTALRVCGVIALTVMPVDGIERLPLTITPTQAFAPAAMRIRARIEPNADNRVFAIVADGNEFYRRSDIQLDGDQAPKTIEMRLSNLPGGECEIFAALLDVAGHERAIVRQSARIIPPISGR